MIRLYLLLTFLISLPNLMAAPNSGTISSYEGRHFLVGFLDNEINIYREPDMTIYISSKYNTDVTVTEPQSSETYTFHLKKDQVAPIVVQAGYEHIRPELTHNNMLIEISSSAPISCVAKSSSPQSGDKFSIIPTRNWGTEHYAVSMPNDYYIEPINAHPIFIEQQKQSRLGEFLVLANENFTNIEITVAADTYGGIPKDSTIKVQLSKGQSYLVKSKYSHGEKGVHDLTGSKIVSDKPVGVVSGHMRTSIYQQFQLSVLDSKDHIVEMLPSTNAWSNEYISLPFGNGIKSMFKVIARDTLTLTVTNDFNTNTVNLLPGEVKQFNGIDIASHWSADGDFLLAQFMAKDVITANYSLYDPSMVIVPALNKMINKLTYYASNSLVYLPVSDNIYEFRDQYSFQAVLLLADEDAKNSLKVNGFNTNNTQGFNEVDADGVKYYWQKVFIHSTPRIVNIEADSGKFSAIAIANGSFDSYAMTVGASLIDEEDTENNPPIANIIERCDGFDGEVYDEVITELSGINIVVVDEDESANMNWTVSPISDTTTSVNISGTIINKNFDAKFKCTVTDYFGNSYDYEFYKEGALVNHANNLDFKEINIKKDSCITFILRTEADSVLLESIDLPADYRLDLKVPFSLPQMLRRGRDHYFILCLMNDKDNLESIKDSISLNFACDYNRKIDINAKVISFNLSAENLKLPKILGGTTHIANTDEFVVFTNVGNTDIVADSVILPPSNYFTIDTTDMFPDTLKQGESIKFNKISFTQDYAGDFDYEIILKDNQGIDRKATITGTIGTPQINDLNLEFGDTRIGTSRDSVIEFQNTGSFLSKFKLATVNSTLINDPNQTVLESLDILEIREFESYALKFTYNPLDVNDFTPYRLEAELIERWLPHDTINLIITGNPTLPNIETVDIDLDTIRIFNYKDSSASVISSLGNEKLKIKRILKVLGDESVFEFDNSFYSTRDLDINTTEQLNIRFNGLTLGPQFMVLVVESDAAPNYGTKTDTIHIRGFVLAQDTLSLQVAPENVVVTSCNYDTLNLEIINTGNTTFTLEDIKINATFSYTSIIDNSLGDTLLPNERTIKKVLVFSSGNRTDDIYYDITVHDITQNIDSVITAHSTIESKENQVIIEPFGASSLGIGKRFEVSFKGRFPNRIDSTADILLEVNVDSYNFYLDEDKTTIYFYNENELLVHEINVDLIRDNDKITIKSEKLIDFDFTNVVSWEFKMRFLALLHTDLEGSMELVFNMSDCYQDNNLLKILDVEEVCAYQFRNIILNSLYLDAELLSNVVSYEANLVVSANSEQTGSIYVMDYLGKKYSVLDKILFDKGKNNIILNLSDYANGKYILVVQTNSTTLTKEIIIIK